MINILLTCAGRRNYIVKYFQGVLHDSGGKVFAANSSEYSSALSVADQGFVVPSLYDPGYINVLVSLCQEHRIKAIIPLFDLELPILAEAKNNLQDIGIITIVSSPDVIAICNDKSQTNVFLSQHGLLNPNTYDNLDQAMAALSSGHIKFPLIIKPRWGMGSIGLFEAENINELRILYSKSQKSIESSYLTYISKNDINKAVIIQEKILGEEYGLDIINDLQGQYITTLVKRKISMHAGETDCAVTVDNPLLSQLGEMIGTKLGHAANLDVDIILNENGPYILEMNPRIGGGYPFSHLAGAKLPEAITAWLVGKKVDHSFFNIEIGVVGFKGIEPIRLRNKTDVHDKLF